MTPANSVEVPADDPLASDAGILNAHLCCVAGQVR